MMLLQYLYCQEHLVPEVENIEHMVSFVPVLDDCIQVHFSKLQQQVENTILLVIVTRSKQEALVFTIACLVHNTTV